MTRRCIVRTRKPHISLYGGSWVVESLRGRANVTDVRSATRHWAAILGVLRFPRPQGFAWVGPPHTTPYERRAGP